MREFKFDIDDWTGGNTIGKSMGDVIGSTVKQYTFKITTSDTDQIKLRSNVSFPIEIDWGDGKKDTCTNFEYAVHNYKDKEEQVVKFYIDVQYLPILEKKESYVNVITCTTRSLNDDYDITGYYVGNINGLVKRFFTISGGYAFPVIIEQGAKVLCTHAFHDMIISNHLVIPDSVTKINEFAFSYTTLKKGVTLPDSNIEISEDAFKYTKIASYD